MTEIEALKLDEMTDLFTKAAAAAMALRAAYAQVPHDPAGFNNHYTYGSMAMSALIQADREFLDALTALNTQVETHGGEIKLSVPSSSLIPAADLPDRRELLPHPSSLSAWLHDIHRPPQRPLWNRIQLCLSLTNFLFDI